MSVQNTPQVANPNSGTNDALLRIESAVKIAALHSVLIFSGLFPFVLYIVYKGRLGFEGFLNGILINWAIAFGYFIFWLWRWNINIMRKEKRDGVDYNGDGVIGKRRPTLYLRMETPDGDDGHVTDTKMEETQQNIRYLQIIAQAALDGNPTSQAEMKRLHKMPKGIWTNCMAVFEDMRLLKKESKAKNARYVIVHTLEQDESVSRGVLEKIARGDWTYLEDIWDDVRPRTSPSVS